MKNVLVVGDIMVDEYITLSSNRLAPESGLPIYEIESREYRLGGAANVANNVKSLLGMDVEVHLVGILGNCKVAFDLLKYNKINTNLCVGSETMFKTRFIDQNKKHLYRVDNFKKFNESNLKLLKGQLRCSLWNKQFDAVIFSDYDKGTIDQEIVDLCKKSELIAVDSKKEDLRLFQGATVLKLNEDEFSRQVSQKNYSNVESLFETVVVTKGEKGSQIRVFSSDFHKKPQQNWMPSVNKSTAGFYTIHSMDFPVEKVEAVDVTGCGDTYCAALTVSLMCGKDIVSSVIIANKAATQVVKQFGTSTTSLEEIKDENESNATFGDYEHCAEGFARTS